MKRWIHATTASQERGYIDYLNIELGPEIFGAINKRVFDPIAENWINNVFPTLDEGDDYVQRSLSWIKNKNYHCHYAPDRIDFACNFYGLYPEEFKLAMGAYGWGNGNGNCGLLFLADIGSGGIGDKCCIRLSGMRAKQRRKMNEILTQISEVLQDFGLELTGPIKTEPGCGYVFNLTV